MGVEEYPILALIFIFFITYEDEHHLPTSLLIIGISFLREFAKVSDPFLLLVVNHFLNDSYQFFMFYIWALNLSLVNVFSQSALCFSSSLMVSLDSHQISSYQFTVVKFTIIFL